jgi:rifampicin phosphotransferase
MSLPEGTWTHDPSHYPEPMTPLSADVWFAAMGSGIQAAARELRAPFGGFETAIVDGGWAYERELEPSWEPDSDALAGAALAVAGRWEQEFRERSHQITAELAALRPQRLAADQAVAALRRLQELVEEQWRIHFLTVIPVHAAREILHDSYVELLGKRDELEPYALLLGLPNETLDADRRLWAVAELARQRDVADLILELPAQAALEQLARTLHGREVLLALWEHLGRYGGRSRLHELSEPRDAEQPAAVLQTVRLFLEHPRDLEGERVAAQTQREALRSETLSRIPDPAARGRFEQLLDQVSAAVALEETHAYHIDYPGLAATREALIGFGARLVAEGRIEQDEDVFHLRREELADALGAPWGEPLAELVAQRRAARAEAQMTRPAPYLGTPPDPDAEIPAMVAKFYGDPASASHDGDLIVGTGASPGDVCAVARVITGPADFARVSAGEVLVCATTTPAWTPLFSSLAGLITDTGGILCHAAVVAREYGLPAVVGAQVATRVIPDGALVRLDGASGQISILRRDDR